jgi:hypothetical protein
MRHKILQTVTILLLLICSKNTQAQEVGISVSYFIPKNGYLSTPISPFSLRGIGFNMGNFFAIQSGFSLYRMSGMNVKNMGELESKDPIVGPNFTLMIPLELVFQLVGQNQEFRIKGGGFAFQTFDNKLNYGNLDKSIRKYEGWDVANANVDFDPGLGLGYYFGAEYIIYVTRQWGLSFEANYFIGDANFPLKGTYSGGNLLGTIDTKSIDYNNAKLDFTGLEISIGVIITQ